MTDQGAALSEADPGIHARLELVAAALRSHNIEAIIVDSGREAKEVVLGLIPEGAEAHSGKSKTLEDVGLFAELIESGRYDAVRPRMVLLGRFNWWPSHLARASTD